MGTCMKDFIEIEHLNVVFKTRNGPVSAVIDVSFSVKSGETIGIVGESASGKSVTTYALMRILDRSGEIIKGTVYFSGIDIRGASETQMRDLRGREMSMIFQNPRAALNPIRKIGVQIEDVLKQHAQAVKANAKAKAVDLLNLVKIRDAENRYHAYPYELSGGMCQRVVIALALACQPRLLIADEPTTGLDVTTQKSVMDLIGELTHSRNMSTILITHDLGLAAAYCDRIIVMKSGEVVETAQADKIFVHPEHQYTRRLMRATPRPSCTIRDLLSVDTPAEDQTPCKTTVQSPPASTNPLLRVQDLTKTFPLANNGLAGGFFGSKIKQSSKPESNNFIAVDNVSLEIYRGQSVGLVGESGCGKSTTSAMIMRLLEPTSGTIELNGADLTEIPVKKFAQSAYRPKLQMVFQDPTDSLNPRFTAERAISDTLLRLGGNSNRNQIKQRVEEISKLVDLPLNLLGRFPHQLSGGQKARVGIARAISLDPELLILDEPTAALDVSVQAVVLNLLYDLKVKLGMSYLFVSHDLNVIRLLCDTVLVMKAGKIVEQGDVEQVMNHPKSTYTQALIAAIPRPPNAI